MGRLSTLKGEDLLAPHFYLLTVSHSSCLSPNCASLRWLILRMNRMAFLLAGDGGPEEKGRGEGYSGDIMSAAPEYGCVCGRKPAAPRTAEKAAQEGAKAGTQGLLPASSGGGPLICLWQNCRILCCSPTPPPKEGVRTSVLWETG